MNYLIGCEPEPEYFNPYAIRCGTCKHFQVSKGDADQSYGVCKLSWMSAASLDKACTEYQEEEDPLFF
jgi:hypothetical protein